MTEKRKYRNPKKNNEVVMRISICLFCAHIVLCSFSALEETIDFSGIADLDVGDTRTTMRHYAAASGFFITANGYLVTDKFAIEEAERFIVVHDNKAYEAQLVKVPPTARFSLLKVNGGSFPQAVITQGGAKRAGSKLLLGGFAASNEHGAIAQYARGVISGVTQTEYELYVSAVPEQAGAIVADGQGLCEGMLLGGGTKSQTVNRVLQWRKIYDGLPVSARTKLLYLTGKNLGGADAQQLVGRCSALVLAYNDKVREKMIRKEGKEGHPAKQEDGKKITIKDLGTLTLKSSQGKTHCVGNGSGFFITSDGYFVTNYHVIDGVEEVVVIYDDKVYKADVVAKSKDKDLALLKTEGHFKTVRIYDGGACSIGQTIFAVGYPNIDIQGLDVKVTKGIISSKTGIGGNEDLYQMDAAIQPGNSGGPVADEDGRVVGVTVSQVNKRFANVELANYMIKWQVVGAFLPKGVRNSIGHQKEDIANLKFVDAVKSVTDATGLVVVYAKGRGGISPVEMGKNDRKKMERYIQRRMLAARSAKLHKEWKEVEEHTDEVLRFLPEDADAKELNNLARTNLGKHLVIRATVCGRDVNAKITPVCGFKNSFVHCDEPIELKDNEKKNGFPVIARLSYEEDGRQYEGRLECIYDWAGTREIQIKLNEKK